MVDVMSGFAQENCSAKRQCRCRVAQASSAADRAAALTDWFLQPGGQRSLGEKAALKGRRSNPHPGLQVRDGFVRKPGVLQRVLVVAERAIDLGEVTDGTKKSSGVAAESDEANARLLSPAQGGMVSLDDWLQFDELDVMAQHNVEVVGAQAVEADVTDSATPLR